MGRKRNPSQVARILAKSNGQCWYCGCGLTPYMQGQHSPTSMNIEHQTPKAKGGTNREENLVYSCQTCNFSKGGSTVEEYRLRLQRKTNPELSACELLKKAISDFPDLHRVDDIKEIIAAIEAKELPAIVFYGEWLRGQSEVAA